MFNFTSSIIPNNVFVIGAGGTGGRLIPLLSQFMRSITRGVSPMGWLESPRIWLIDDDVVEQKNLLRQNFIDRDVGKYKAAVLAERYTRAYNVPVIPIIRRIETDSAQDFYKDVNDNLFVMNGNIDTVKFNNIIGSSVVIICVDSVEARRDILNVFVTGDQPNKTFFIDAGNEDSFGQVSFFTSSILLNHKTNSAAQEIPKLCPVSADVDFIPIDVDYYKGLVDTPAQGSCADLNQTLAINAIMATTIMGVVQNCFYRKPMTYNKVSISLDGGNHTTYNTFNNLNNAGISKETWHHGRNGDLYSQEREGRRKQLGFVGRAHSYEARDLRQTLLDKMEEINRQAELARRKAAEEAERAAEQARIKIVADRKREEIRRLVEAARQAREAPVAPTLADAVAAVAAVETEALTVPAAPPPLTPVRQRTRRVVALALPPTDAYVEGDADDNEVSENDWVDLDA
jgi:molybdopterin/thiamine biosynthesis adenylyltransferase